MEAEVCHGIVFSDGEFKDLPRLWTKSVVSRTETLGKNITRTHQVLWSLPAEMSLAKTRWYWRESELFD